MSRPKHSGSSATVARTVRFPRYLRDRVAADAERCGRSFEAHVLAILRRHYGEDVDIAPAPETLLELAQASFEGLSAADRRAVSARLYEDEEG